jgi:hypothetical protein
MPCHAMPCYAMLCYAVLCYDKVNKLADLYFYAKLFHPWVHPTRAELAI